MKKSIIAFAISAITFGAQAVELTNGENNELLINGSVAATYTSVIDADGNPVPHFSKAMINGTGVVGVLTLGDAVIATKIFESGIDVNGGVMLGTMCDENGNTVGKYGYRDMPFLKGSHVVAYDTHTGGSDILAAKVGEYKEFTHCGSGEKMKGFELTVDETVTIELNNWMESLKTPLSVSLK